MTLLSRQRQHVQRLAILCVGLLASLGCGLSSGIAEDARDAFRVVGYLPDYRFNRFDPEQAGQLTDIVLFAVAPNEEGEVQLGKLATAPWEELFLLRKNQGTRLILCVGGWGQSNHFAHVVTSPLKRERFVSSTVQLLIQHKLNGLDIDWEYPETDDEWNGYVELLRQLQSAFRPRGLSLSLTVAPSRKLPKSAWEQVDTLQLMCYDYGQRHSTLEQYQTDVQSFLQQGVPPKKLVMGVPFYGRDIQTRKAMTYSGLVERFHPQPEKDEVEGYFFNGPRTIREKTEYAIFSGIGGVMIWEIGQDTADETSLLRTIRETIDQQKNTLELSTQLRE